MAVAMETRERTYEKSALKLQIVLNLQSHMEYHICVGRSIGKTQNHKNIVSLLACKVTMCDRLTPNQLAEIDAAFKMYDKNGDGQITVKELGSAMKEAGQMVSNDELKDMIRVVDLNGNGKVEYQEFVQMIANQLGSPMPTDELKNYFDRFDINGDGFIGADEMQCLVKAFYSNLSGSALDHQVKSMIEAADTNNDGKISFEEFEKVLKASG